MKKNIFRSFALNDKKAMESWGEIYQSFNPKVEDPLNDEDFAKFLEKEENFYKESLIRDTRIIMDGDIYKAFSLHEKFFKEGYSKESRELSFDDLLEALENKSVEIYDKKGDLYIDLYGDPKSKKTTFLVKLIKDNELKKVDYKKKEEALCL